MSSNLEVDALQRPPLSPREAAATRYLLMWSALRHCDGVAGRIVLSTDVDGRTTLQLHDLSSWGWSSGERVLVDVLLHIAGFGPDPQADLWRLDETNHLVVSEAMALLRGEQVAP